MPYPLPLTRTEAYLAYKAGVIQQSDLKPSLSVPRNGIDAWLAYWTGLAADYPKREDGTPHILQEEEAYIAYLCGVINEYPEKCLRRVGAYLRYLISARWGRPDHPLNREELYLSLIKTQFIPSGDPSSDITIDGTAKAPFVDVKMYGDTFQQTYTGKNLLPPDNGTTTGGITTSWNSDGTVDITGTATGAWPQITRLPYALGATIPSGTQLTLSMTEPLPTGTRLWFREYSVGENTYKNHPIPNNGTSVTFSISADMDRVGFVLGTTAGTTLDIRGLGIMLEVGSTATSFEPFVGGQPSPNPEYPQAIQTVTGRQVVNVQGKNLFTNIPTGSNNGVDFTLNNDGTYDIDGRATAQANNAIFITDLSKLTDGATYTLSATKALPSGVQVMFEVFNGSTWVRHALGDSGFLNSGRQSITGQLDLSGGNRLRLTLRVQNGTTVGLKNLGVQLELGSTVTAYEPYSSNDYEINLGKNLFDKNNYSDQTGYYIGGNGVWRSGGAGEHYFVFRVEPNTTYTFSKNAQASYNRFRVGISSGEPTVGVAFPIWGGGDTATEITLTTASDSKYAYVYYSVTVNVQEAIQSLQIEAGSHKTPYAPYFTPIELCKLGTYQDYIWKDGDSWKIHKATATIDFYGTSGWYVSGKAIKNTISGLGIAEIAGYSESSKNIPAYIYSLGQGIQTPVYSGSVDNAFSVRANYSPITSSQNGILLRAAGKWSSASDFNTWLQTNHLTMFYALATPTDTTITDQTLIAQLEALASGGAENGTTYIKVNTTDPNLPGLLYVEAPKYE